MKHTSESMALSALRNFKADLYDDARQEGALKQIENLSLGMYGGNYAFYDGSVLAVDPYACSVSASQALSVPRGALEKLARAKNLVDTAYGPVAPASEATAVRRIVGALGLSPLLSGSVFAKKSEPQAPTIAEAPRVKPSPRP